MNPFLIYGDRPTGHKRSTSLSARKSVNLNTFQIVDSREVNRGVEAKKFRESLRKSSMNRSVSTKRDVSMHDRDNLSPTPVLHASTTKNIPSILKTSSNQYPIQSIGN